MRVLFANLIFIITFGISAQHSIPEISNIKDSLVHPEFGDSYYSSAYSTERNRAPSITYSQNVGDFDGDGSDDIFVQWYILARYYDKSGMLIEANDGRNHFGIYSYTKNRYLFTGVRKSSVGSNVVTGDFNNDDKIDFVVGSQIYLGVNSLSKKKVYP